MVGVINEFNEELYHPGEWRWQEGDYTVTRTGLWSAPGCHNGCGILAYTKDGEFSHVEGDPLSGWHGRLCERCLDVQEMVYHEDRIKYPMLLDGPKGSNKWKRISWDEAYEWIRNAYDDVCETIRQYPGGIGPEGIVAVCGTGRNTMWQQAMILRGVFGSPNFTSAFLSGECCYQPRSFSALFKFGDTTIADCAQTFPDRYYNDQYVVPEVILVWGNEPLHSNGDIFGHWLIDLMRMGSKLIVVDPALTWLASKAEIHLKVRPGTDTALALAMMNVIINEDLYDHDFVDNWVFGFDEYKEHVQDWTPERAEEMCWVPADDVRAAARLFATAKPATLQWGLALDQQISGFEACSAIEDLTALTGNLDVPGGNIIIRYAYNSSKKYGCGMEFLSQEMLDRRIGLDETPIVKAGYSPMLTSDRVLEQMESGDPYPIMMMWVQGSNGIACTAQDSSRVYNAWKKVKYTVVHDYVMTPTAVAFADLVLPCAMSFERASYRSWYNPLRAITPCADRYYEAKSDDELVLELGKQYRPDFFGQFDTIEDFLTWMIQDEGNGVDYDWTELSHRVYDYWDWDMTYKKYEKGLLRRDGRPGFSTATGLYEMASPIAELLDMNPLPEQVEPYESPYRTPELMEEYPYLLTTGHRHWGFFHSENRQQKYMRQFEMFPDCDISPEMAEKEGIEEGDMIWIETDRSRIKQKAHIAPGGMPELVRVRHGWWFPEQEAAEPNLYGTFDSNGNALTTMGVVGRCGYGSPTKSLICKIYKVTPENDCSPTEVVTTKGGFGGNHKTKETLIKAT